MVFLHIDTKNYKNNNEKLIKQLNNIIDNKKNKVFILYYMEGCGPCNATKPEWAKIKNVLKHLEHDNSIAVVDIDQVLSSKIKGQHQPVGFPTMRFITNNGKTVENYEDSNIDTKDRTIDSFVEWIKSKTNDDNSMKGGQMKYGGKMKYGGQMKYDGQMKYGGKMNKTIKKRRSLKGGKWSRKYKKSINCKRPRGFSQRQYCKYGRKN